MANLSFGVKGTGMDFSTSVQIADTDAPRILTYLASTPYGKDSDDKPVSMEEVARAFALGILQGLLDQTFRHEQEVAAKAASDSVAPIQATV